MNTTRCYIKVDGQVTATKKIKLRCFVKISGSMNRVFQKALKQLEENGTAGKKLSVELIDINANSQLAHDHNIVGFPVLDISFDGVSKRYHGYRSLSELKDIIGEIVG